MAEWSKASDLRLLCRKTHVGSIPTARNYFFFIFTFYPTLTLFRDCVFLASVLLLVKQKKSSMIQASLDK
jgi:hypothetical protein